MDRAIRINIIVNSFPTPSETFLFNLVTGLEKQGMNITVIAGVPSVYTSLYTDRLKEWSGKIKYLKGSPLKSIFFYAAILLRHFRLFLKLLAELGWRKAIYHTGAFKALTYNNPDIIHFAFSGIAVQYLPIIHELNKKASTVVSCRGTGEKVRPIVDPERMKKLAILFQSIHRVHCVSEDLLNTVIQYGLDKKKAFVNRPAIQIENFLFSKKNRLKALNPYNIVTTGRLSYEKGYTSALLALKELEEKGKHFEYHILGDGPDKEQIQYLIHELGLQKKVHVHGKVSAEKVRDFLIKSHIFLLPSVYEGISNAALEAMAMGVPLITTNAGGMEEVVQNGVNGIVIPKFDHIAMANALLDVMDNYEQANAMAEKAYETILTNHRLEKQIDVFIKEYNSLIHAYVENSSL